MLLCSLFTVAQEVKLKADKSPKLELCIRQGSHKTLHDFQKMWKPAGTEETVAGWKPPTEVKLRRYAFTLKLCWPSIHRLHSPDVAVRYKGSCTDFLRSVWWYQGGLHWDMCFACFSVFSSCLLPPPINCFIKYVVISSTADTTEHQVQGGFLWGTLNYTRYKDEERTTAMERMI